MDFVTVAQNLGIAVACLFALGYAVWRIALWMAENVIKPLTDRHIRFLDELSTAIAAQSQALQTMAVQQGKNIERLDALVEAMEHTHPHNGGESHV